MPKALKLPVSMALSVQLQKKASCSFEALVTAMYWHPMDQHVNEQAVTDWFCATVKCAETRSGMRGSGHPVHASAFICRRGSMDGRLYSSKGAPSRSATQPDQPFQHSLSA